MTVYPDREVPWWRSILPVVTATVILVVVTNLPYLVAGLFPWRGTKFLGVFFSIPDVYNYLSYVQQAEDGAFLFVNKLVTAPHPPALVNLEWWTVGRLSWLLGFHPIVAYRILGGFATLLLAAATDRLLRLSGLPSSHRLPALLLVLTGAGAGGLRYEWLGPPAWRSLDLVTGLFPFIGILVNPHFVLGTALLLWTLLVLFGARTWRGGLLGVVLGTVLGLCRPYELVLLVTIRAVVVFATEPRDAWVARLAPLLGLVPVVTYNYWVFFRNPEFSVLSAFDYVQPPLGDFLIALAPAALLALLALKSRPVRSSPESAARTHLFAWVLAGALILLRSTSFSMQCLVSFGLPFLALGALGLARLPRAATAVAALAYSTTALIALHILLAGSSTWLVPKTLLDAAHALRPSCRPDDLLLSPPDLGLYANASSACKAYVSHKVMREFDAREAEVGAFYAEMPPGARSEFLDLHGITHLALPGAPGAIPEAWLGSNTPFRLLAAIGEPPGSISLYVRSSPLPAMKP